MIKRKRRQKGQAFIEYVILIVVIALAALFVLASFSDRLRDMITGVTVTLGGSKAEKDKDSSMDFIKDLDKEGIQ